MATYSKLPKVIQDYGLGLQTVNQAADNEQALNDAWDAKHRVISSSLPQQKFRKHGGHDDWLIPRAVASVRTSSLPLFGGTTSATFWFDLVSATGVTIQAQAQRIVTGVYLLPLAFVDDESVWADVSPRGSGTEKRIVSSRFFAQLSSSPGPKLLVRCFELASGAFGLTDFDFDVAIFSR